MTSPSAQWIVNALREATEAMPLPPESRWIREPRSTSHDWAIAMFVATAIVIIAVAGVISGLRLEPRVVPVAQPSVSAVVQDAEWARVRAELPADVVVLRPTWIPLEYRGSVNCWPPYASAPKPLYDVRYLRELPNGLCAALDFTQVAGVHDYTGFPDQLVDVGTVDVRSAVVGVRAGTMTQYGPAYQMTCLWWNEGGATYEVCGLDLALVDLVRVVRDLEPVR